MRKNVLLAIQLLLFTTFLCFAGNSCLLEEIGPEKGYPIGVLIPMSGSLGPKGDCVLDSLELALGDVNKYFEELRVGKFVRLFVYDSGSDPKMSLEALREMEKNGIKLVIGPIDSESTKQILEFANEKSIVLLSPTTSSPALSIAGDNLLRLVPDDDVHAKALARLIRESGKDVCVSVFRGDEWGRGFFNSFKKAFEDLDGKVVDGIEYPVDTDDFSNTLTNLESRVEKLNDEFGTDRIAVQLSSYLEGIEILAQAANYDILPDVNWYSQEILAREPMLLNNPEAAGFAAKTGFTCSVFSQNQAILTTPRLVLQDMVIKNSIYRYAETDGDQWILPTWDALWLYAIALAENDFTDDSIVIRDFILKTARRYLGISAHLRLNENGDRMYGDYAFYRVSKSAKDYIWDLAASYNYVFGEEHFKFIDESMEESSEIRSGNFKVGALIPLNGEGAISGTSVRAGIQAAYDDISKNRSGDENVASMELFVEDTYSDANIALEKLEILDELGVKVVIGPCLSQELENIREYAKQNGITLISPASDAPSLAVADDSVFRFVPNAVRQGGILAQVITGNGVDSVIPVWRNDIWGIELKDAVSEKLREQGCTVLDGVGYDAGVPDSRNTVAKIVKQLSKANGKTAVVLISFGEGIGILEEASNYPEFDDTCWYGSESICQSDYLIKNAKAAAFALKTDFVCPAFALEIFGNADSIPLSIPRIAVMTRIFDKLGEKPNVYAYTAYDSLWTAYLAWEAMDRGEYESFDKAFSGTAGGLIGVSNFLGLDKAGDRSNANYDFYTVSKNLKGEYGWKRIATYFSNPFKQEPIWFYY